MIIVAGVSGGGGDGAPTAAPAAGGDTSSAPAAAPFAPDAAGGGGDVITYEVTGSGTAANMTYVKDENMEMEQANGSVCRGPKR